MMFLKRAPASKSVSMAVLLTISAHISVVATQRRVLTSNILQLLAGLLPTLLCVTIAQRKKNLYFRNAWLTLAVAFGIWSAAQTYFVSTLVCTHTTPGFPSIADLLWMAFAFPILLVTVVRRSWKRTEPVTWLDCAQSCVCFGILYALVFSHPAILSVSTAYDAQSAGLILVCALRFYSTQPGPERTFFRNLGIYLIIYGAASSLGNRLQGVGAPRGSWSDLCWSLPPLFFCLLVLFSRLDYTSSGYRAKRAE